MLGVGADRSYAELVERSLRGAADDVRGDLLESCGHWITEERPREITTLLLDFLGRRAD